MEGCGKPFSDAQDLTIQGVSEQDGLLDLLELLLSLGGSIIVQLGSAQKFNVKTCPVMCIGHVHRCQRVTYHSAASVHVAIAAEQDLLRLALFFCFPESCPILSSGSVVAFQSMFVSLFVFILLLGSVGFF